MTSKLTHWQKIIAVMAITEGETEPQRATIQDAAQRLHTTERSIYRYLREIRETWNLLYKENII